MSYDANVFRQDLKAAMNALEKDDFETLNIYANRIMSNSHIFKERERMICGLIIKDLSLTLLPLTQKKTTRSKNTTKALAAGFLKKVYDQPENRIDTESLWKDYHSFSTIVHRNLLSEYEESAYSGKNSDFTHQAVKNLLDKLDQNKEKLVEPNCLLLKGILNEISRLDKIHGGELSDEFTYALITAIDRCYEYIVSAFGGTSNFAIEVNAKVIPEIKQMIEILKNVEENGGKWISDIDSKLFELSSRWRDYFILYMEHGQLAKDKVVRIPDESRKKLTEAIARSLEEELPKKNK